MPSTLSPQEFVAKWRHATLKERSAAQEHFIDVCRVVGHATPAEADPKGEWFVFEAGADKTRGGHGWADVWKKGYFAWEYKGKHANLDRAYQQLLQYRESLLNPPLLVISDIDTIVIHTNFTNTVKRVVTLTLDDLLTLDGNKTLRAAFENPNAFKAEQTTEQVTQAAAAEFARMADLLRRYGEEPGQAAHFLIRILFCLFAEDIGLLPHHLFTRLVEQTLMRPAALTQQLRQLFAAMASGGMFGSETIQHFDGGLFDDDRALTLDSEALRILANVTKLDWSSIEPSIFGTLFERSLDPSKRSQIGAHFTSKEDILLIVEPVLMTLLRRRWAEVEKEVRAFARERDAIKGNKANREKLTEKIRVLLQKFQNELRHLRILDPACGSGNFLYVSLRQLLDLEKQLITLTRELGIKGFLPLVGPEQLYGIEINAYAHELAQTTVWIGYIQWLRENGYGKPTEPILKRLDNIKQIDAILAFDANGKPMEPEWQEADVIIGNPPFLGSRKMRPLLGERYCDALLQIYSKQIEGMPDLVCYWFEKAREHIENGKAKRAGLLATQAIRGGTNRQVLDRINSQGNIFMAWADREWTLDGATVHVSIVGFDNGEEQSHVFNGAPVARINSDLTANVDLATAQRLAENEGLSFQGVVVRGKFNISTRQAKAMLAVRNNPNGRPNSDVIRPRRTAQDIVGRSSNEYVIDFGIDLPKSKAALYEAPFQYLERVVYPERQKTNQIAAREQWWIHWNPRKEMRGALSKLKKYIATPRVGKHRIFVWLDKSILPDTALVVFARDDDYFFGVLHSKPHELWARRMGTQLRDAESGFRYTNTTTFETFSFPWKPEKEPKSEPRFKAIARAAKELAEERDRRLNPPGTDESNLKNLTLTQLYNEYPTWLKLAHKKLDDAVLDAYGWKHDSSDEEILTRLLELNLARAEKNSAD